MIRNKQLLSISQYAIPLMKRNVFDVLFFFIISNFRNKNNGKLKGKTNNYNQFNRLIFKTINGINLGQ